MLIFNNYMYLELFVLLYNGICVFLLHTLTKGL